MTQSIPSIVLMAALFIDTLSHCSAENVYCVTPTVTSCSSCPHNNHCATLSEYAQDTELYFTSNTTMVFLPGHHALHTNITVTNTARLTMQGQSLSGNIATVVCHGSVGLSFTNMVEFKIYSLHFTACSRSSGGPPPSRYYALLLQSTQYAALVNCSFYDNIGNALLVKNTSVTLAGNSEFIHNYCESSCIGGGGITALSSNIAITGNATFFENLGIFHGRGNNAGVAIYANNTILSFSGVSNFSNNLAIENAAGIAIAATSNSVLIFDGTNNFINNSAPCLYGVGGAISITYNTTLRLNGANNFINNSAPRGGVGGAIAIQYNSVLFLIGTNKFINNSGGIGGAIYTEINVVIKFNGNNSFINNSAINLGGAIYSVINSTLVFNGTIYFTHNKVGGAAGYGGGLCLEQRSTFSISPNALVYWENNHAAVFGGAIYFSDYSPFSYCVSSDDPGSYMAKEECFFQPNGQNLSSGSDAELIFKNNSADVAGNVLFGGVVDNCKLTGLYSSNSSCEVFDMLVNTDDNMNSNI